MLTDNLQQQFQAEQKVTVSGLRGSSPFLFAAQLQLNPISCCIVPDDHSIPAAVDNLQLFTNKRILTYPGHEIPPYTPLSPDQKITATRLASLYQIAETENELIIVTSIEALLRKVIPKAELQNRVELIMAGEDFDHDELVNNLLELGYDKVALAKNCGDFSVRGGIIDIYPPPFVNSEGKIHTNPIRLDFFGDTIESLRSFDPLSQRSTTDLDEALLLPVKEFILDKADKTTLKNLATTFQKKANQFLWDEDLSYEMMEKLKTGQGIAGIEFFLPIFFKDKLSTFFDFLPKNSQLIFLNSDGISQALKLSYERIEKNYLEVAEEKKPALPPEEVFLNKEQLSEHFSQFKQFHITDLVEDDSAKKFTTSDHLLLKQDIASRLAKEGVLSPLIEKISQWQEESSQVFICCRSSKHTKNLAEMLSRHHKQVEIVEPPLTLECNEPDLIRICDHPLAEGFSLTENNVHLVSESQLFGQMRLGSKKKASSKFGDPIEFSELHPGDIVVHRDHGLGIFAGLETITVQQVTNDFMSIEYRDADKLYLPVDKLNLISRYQGLSDKEPKIDKLGSTSWRTTTKKIKEEVWKVAQELLDIYAKREIKEGRRFSPAGALFQELEESFPFDETPGQQNAINDVIGDLTTDQPMDRLVCGDVGYGKTEVAIRGAFKVIEDGFQVAVLVPTTVLAEQHLQTFKERLQNFPVNVACLNRFRSSKEQKQIVADLAASKVDVVIGTHRLLSKDVSFKNLGLLVIDEEHRFGVAHKEKIKKLRAEVDILTLTATPIPRTLQMSLLAIRDLSVISSPPEQRRPVKTFVAQHDELVIKEAVTRELRRKGQTFFVHNRVKSIYKVAATIEKLVPDARIAVAHGQMKTKELEDIMVAFVNREIDVLVATTIIESGLDIPSANTIIINRADALGLAEMYQLRGRVGRSSTQSFAYLLVPSLDSITKDSRERLRALMECSELGGGFKLAMNDLQIRGGGNLLGVSQSGNIAAIGYDLYLDLLQKTVADLKARGTNGDAQSLIDDLDPEINLQLSAFIPTNYIPDVNQRYIMYRRIAALIQSGDDAFSDLRDEIIDRYGSIPKETKTLINIIDIKRTLVQLRINKLERGAGTIVYSFLDDTPIEPQNLLNFINAKPATKKQPQPKLTQDGRLVTYGVFEGDMLLNRIRETLIDLFNLVKRDDS